MIETKKSRHPSSIIRLLREAGGFHFLILALIACTGEGLGKVFLSLNGGRMLDSFLVQDRQGALTALLLVVVYVLVMAIGIIVKDSLLGSYQEHGMVRLRLRTVKSLSMTKLSWLDGRHSGELSARVSGDLNALAGALRPVLIMGISLAIVQIITVTFLFTLHLRLTLLIFGVVPVTVLLQWLSSNPIKKYRTANRNAMGQLSSVLYDCAGSMETIKSLSLEEEMRHRFAATQALQMSARLKEERIVAALSPVSVFSRYLPQMVLIIASRNLGG